MTILTRFLVSFFLCFLCTDAFAVKEFAKRYPTDTPLEVYTPNNPPPSGSSNVGIGSTMIDGTPGSVLFVGAGPTFAQDNSNLFFDDTGNNLGIGSTAPSATIDVNVGTTGIRPSITQTGFGAGAAGIFSDQQSSGSSTAKVYGVIGLSKITSDASGGEAVGGYFKASSANVSLTQVGLRSECVDTPCYAAKFGRAGTVNAVIMGDGNMGIGTIVPASQLHVKSGTSGLLPYASTSLTLDSSGANYLSILAQGGNESGIFFGSGSNSNIDVGIVANNAGNRGMQFRTGGNVDQVFINSSGNVGIGTSATVARLQVVGNVGIGTSGIFITTTPPTGGVIVQGNVGIGTWVVPSRLYSKGAFAQGVITLTDGATVNTDASLGNHFRLATTQNFTLANPTNSVDGQRIVWEITQDGTGSRVMTLGGNFKFGSDITAATLSTAANKKDFMTAIYNVGIGTWHVVGFVKGY